MSAIDVQALVLAIDAERQARAEKMPTEQDCLRVMADAHQRMRELGWNDAVYCPKDGAVFDAIEPGSSGIHSCQYTGEWPTGSWWIQDEADLWPSRPSMYRLKAPKSNAPP